MIPFGSCLLQPGHTGRDVELLVDKTNSRKSPVVMDVNSDYRDQTAALYQTVIMFISTAKLDILTWESMGLCSVTEPAPSGQLRNCNFCFVLLLGLASTWNCAYCHLGSTKLELWNDGRGKCKVATWLLQQHEIRKMSHYETVIWNRAKKNAIAQQIMCLVLYIKNKNELIPKKIDCLLLTISNMYDSLQDKDYAVFCVPFLNVYMQWCS